MSWLRYRFVQPRHVKPDETLENKVTMFNRPSSEFQPTQFSSLRPRALTPAASAHLDLVRALAAWAVMWGHVRANFFVNYRDLQHRSLALKALYFLTGFGHQAVMVFFVLSGFLISSSVISSYLSGRWSWRDYAINRSSRLYMVLIPGLLLGYLWDHLGISNFSSTGLYSRPLEGFGSAVVQNQVTLWTFIGNLFFLQTITCPTFGSNGPLWSLSNEFWYYVLFPVGMFAGLAWAKRRLSRAIPLTILAFGLLYFLGSDKVAGFLVWMAGCTLVFAYSAFPSLPHRRLTLFGMVSSLLLLSCLTAARFGKLPALASDVSMGLAFTLFLFGVLHLNFGGESPHYRKAARFFAGFSYSLYVLHFPLLLFLRARIAPLAKWQPDAAHLVYGIFIGIFALGFAWLVSTVTEDKTATVRGWMKRVLPQYGSSLMLESRRTGSKVSIPD
jgi:peptidoglycan/LPS O-acetylase OafA/YrhL